MRLRWTSSAAADLQQIADRLFEEIPASAPAVVRRIYNAPERLTTFPESGRPGRQAGTRELVIPALPYVMVYDLSGDVVRILRVLHGAQKWP
jgi:toxin ParE1/3/4